MKILFSVFLTLSLLVFSSITALAHDPYSYEPSPYSRQQDDPYYLLHMIHYQLYRQQYPSQNYVQVFVVGTAPKQIRPWRQAKRW